MKTASFFTYTGPGRISIARFAPRRTPAGFRMFKSLAPGSWFNSVTPARYVELFDKEILGVLDPRETWKQVHDLAGGAEPVLLCWEKPTDQESDPNAYCHRALVARFFEKALGEKVPEIGYETAPRHPLLPQLVATDSQRSLFV